MRTTPDLSSPSRSRARFHARAAVVAVLATIGLLGSAAARAAAKTPSQVLHPAFSAIATNATLVASSRYVYVGGGPSAPESATTGVIYDEQTGTHKRVSFPDGCAPSVVGAGAVALTCSATPGVLSTTQPIYNIASGTTTSVPTTPLASDPSLTCDDGCPEGQVTQIGSDWIELGFLTVVPPGDLVYEYDNRQTGTQVTDPRSASVNVDLASPTLSRKVCSPLTLPTAPSFVNGGFPQFGVLIPDHGYVIEGSTFYRVTWLLGRCGTTSTLKLDLPTADDAPVENSHAVIWFKRSAHGAVDGIQGVELPNRRRFTVHIPSTVLAALNRPDLDQQPSPLLALSATHIYLEGGCGQVWRAPGPFVRATR
jgi:hypothetical protein